MNFHFLYKVYNWLKWKMQPSIRYVQSDAVAAVHALEKKGLIQVDYHKPMVWIDYQLHISMCGKREFHTRAYQQFLVNLHLYINFRRATFNGAASEGYAVGPNGETKLQLLNPGNTVTMYILVGDEPVLQGVFNQFDFHLTTIDE